MREGTTSRVTVADRPYGEFYDFYSISLENFGYHLVHGYNRHMAYADKRDCMRDKEAIFTPLDFPMLKSFMLLTSCS